MSDEVLLRGELAPDELAADLDQVRAAVTQKVTYADVWEYWEKYPAIAAHVDIVTVHILPYWEDHPISIGHAVDHIHKIYDRMKARFPGRPISIGETGWPSRGRWRHDAAPGPTNQASFLRRFVALADQTGFDYNLIEAFDQGWKYKTEGRVGANWGLWTTNPQPKIALTGTSSGQSDWLVPAVLAELFSLALLVPALTASGLAKWRLRLLTLLASVSGEALGYACWATAPELYDGYARVAAAGNLSAQAVLALLLMQRATRWLAEDPPARWRNGKEATETMRRLLRLQLPANWSILYPDLTFVFAWTAAVLQLLLVFDPRYRDFPLPCFAVPVVSVFTSAALCDMPSGGGREELCVGVTLIAGAAASILIEGFDNLQAIVWNVVCFVLAAPLLVSLATPHRA